jgi:small subunit ribosomal protein S24e
MEIKIVHEKHNPLMNRKELKVEIPHSRAATPSKAQVQHLVAGHFKVDVKHVFVDRVLSGVGKALTTAFVDVYTKPVSEDLAQAKKAPAGAAAEAKPEEKKE